GGNFLEGDKNPGLLAGFYAVYKGLHGKQGLAATRAASEHRDAVLRQAAAGHGVKALEAGGHLGESCLCRFSFCHGLILMILQYEELSMVSADRAASQASRSSLAMGLA